MPTQNKWEICLRIVFAFKNKAESEQEAVLSNKFLLCIKMIYNLGLLFLIHHTHAVLG